MSDEKENQLIEMVSGFCDEKLDKEYKKLCVKLTRRLAETPSVSFKRGKIENWASGIIYAIGQINFLFDDSFEPYLTPDDICNYFNTKKSTAANKARDIRKLFDMGLGDKDFSTKLVLNSGVEGFGSDLSRAKTLSSAHTDVVINLTVDMIKEISKRMQ